MTADTDASPRPRDALGPAGGGAWVGAGDAPLLTDLYQLTMLQAYWSEGLTSPATFELFVRRLPPTRNLLLACGLDDGLRYLERLAYERSALEPLRTRGLFPGDFLDRLVRLRFTGDVWALPEGTPFFAGEPLLRLRAPLPEAQAVETLLMNQLHLQTLLASKAVRVVVAAAGRPVVDFGLRRMHGADAGLKAARAFHVAGVEATSNVLAALTYGLRVSGTMAHSYVLAHDAELEAFRAFARLYPDTVLLVDTYDTLDGVRRVTELARELGDEFRVRAVRLDSGDIEELARGARRILDASGLRDVQVFASGSLDEHEVARLVESGAPVDGFGVGTRMGVSSDAPYLDSAYKLVDYAGRGRMKLSADKRSLPGAKQVFRVSLRGEDVADVIATADETAREAIGDVRAAAAKLPELEGLRGAGLEARPLLVPVMRGGRRLPAGCDDLECARRRAAEELARLPHRVRGLSRAESPYPVLVGSRLEAAEQALVRVPGPD